MHNYDYNNNTKYDSLVTNNKNPRNVVIFYNLITDVYEELININYISSYICAILID